MFEGIFTESVGIFIESAVFLCIFIESDPALPACAAAAARKEVPAASSVAGLYGEAVVLLGL